MPAFAVAWNSHDYLVLQVHPCNSIVVITNQILFKTYMHSISLLHMFRSHNKYRYVLLTRYVSQKSVIPHWYIEFPQTFLSCLSSIVNLSLKYVKTFLWSLVCSAIINPLHSAKICSQYANFMMSSLAINFSKAILHLQNKSQVPIMT